MVRVCGAHLLNQATEDNKSNVILASRKFMNKKNQLRNILKKSRNKISKCTNNFITKNIFERLIKIIFRNNLNVDNIAIYYPINSEISPLKILDLVSKFDFDISLPKIKKNSKILEFLKWDGFEKLYISDFKTLVPKKSNTIVLPDVIFIPMLAFDKKFNRIGYGGGYYDATIKFMRKKKSFLAIGLGYDKQEIVNVPILDHDQRMDLIVTEKRIIQKKGFI